MKTQYEYIELNNVCLLDVEISKQLHNLFVNL